MLNSQETNRASVDSVVDERTLREVYDPPLEAAAHAGGPDPDRSPNLHPEPEPDPGLLPAL